MTEYYIYTGQGRDYVRSSFGDGMVWLKWPTFKKVSKAEYESIRRARIGKIRTKGKA